MADREKAPGAAASDAAKAPSPETSAAPPEMSAGDAGRFSVRVELGQVLLTVQPVSATARPVTKEEVLIACRTAGFTHVESKAVEETVAAADGRAHSIGQHELRPAVIHVRLADGDQRALVHIDPPDPGGRAPTLEDFKAVLRSEGISFGVKDDVLRRLAAEPEYGTDILVAEGRPVVPGEDGWIDYQFDLERHISLKHDADSDRVDFKELNLIENVVEGQLLAVKKPPKAGTAGITVKNEYVAPKPGREVALLAGRNVTLSEDGSEAYAGTNGMPLLLANKVTVSQVYVVKGSVGPATGNINFLGTVQITESVEDGFAVRATDAILVGRTVGKGELEAGGDITVRGGIIEGKCVANGTIRAKFIQESTIESRGDVMVAEAILHSKVQCGGRVIVGLGGRKGTIAGGHIRAWKLVACRVLGSPMSTKTLVDVGINPKLLTRMEELQGEILKDRTNFENLKKGMAALEALRQRLGELPPDKQKIHDTLVLAQNSLRTKLQELAGELKDLQAQSAVKVHGVVSVSEEAHPGAKITIGTSVYYVNKVDKFVTYKEEAREVRIFAYEAPKLDGGRRKGKAGDQEESES